MCAVYFWVATSAVRGPCGAPEWTQSENSGPVFWRKNRQNKNKKNPKTKAADERRPPCSPVYLAGGNLHSRAAGKIRCMRKKGSFNGEMRKISKYLEDLWTDLHNFYQGDSSFIALWKVFWVEVDWIKCRGCGNYSNVGHLEGSTRVLHSIKNNSLRYCPIWMNQKPVDSPINDLLKVFWVQLNQMIRWGCRNY